MPKRRKRRPVVAMEGVRFEEVPTAEMLIFDERNIDKIESTVLQGRFVKVAPRIEASKRDTFPGETIVEYVRANGALGVVMAPVFLPDGKKAKVEKAETMNPREMLARWLDSQNLEDADIRDAVRDLVERYMAEEGI